MGHMQAQPRQHPDQRRGQLGGAGEDQGQGVRVWGCRAERLCQGQPTEPRRVRAAAMAESAVSCC